MNQERAKKPFQATLDSSLGIALDLSRQKLVVVFNLKFRMVNSNPKLNECKSDCESECECEPEPESAPANLNLNPVSLAVFTLEN